MRKFHDTNCAALHEKMNCQFLDGEKEGEPNYLEGTKSLHTVN